MNTVCVVGNLTKDPDLRYSTGANQTAIGRFSIAVDDGYGEKKRTNYISIVVFGKQAENCERYLHKGSKVAIKGRIQTGSYEKEGHKVYTTDVVVEQIEFLKTEQVTQPVEKDSLPPQVPEGFVNEQDGDIPF